MFTEKFSDDVVVRLQVWNMALQDTLAYLVIARNRNDHLYDGGATVKVPNGDGAQLGHSIRRGMFAAAIISFCQTEGAGHGGPNIAGHSDKALQSIRAHLYASSDDQNHWPPGKTKDQVINAIIRERSSFLAHYSGKAANITREVDNPDGTKHRYPRGSWSGHFPNPWYRPDAFMDFEMAVTAMLRELRMIVSHQTSL
ncbi:MAG: hypothetical protein AB7S99_02435 [Pseudodonghicola sp.]